VQEERRRLAREIHDTLAQSLAAIVLQLEASVGASARSGRCGWPARRWQKPGARCSTWRRATSTAPRSHRRSGRRPVLDRGAGRRCDLVVTGEQVALHPEVEATVLRVAQESLSNVARHADASRVGVTLSYDGDHVMLDVRDDGRGFDARPDRPRLLRAPQHATARRAPRRSAGRRVAPRLGLCRVPVPARPGPGGGVRKIRIVVADDHPIVRDGLRSMLSAVADFEVVGEAASGPRRSCASATPIPTWW
jgi:hypothetical protein